jgi:MFS family permease
VTPTLPATDVPAVARRLRRVLVASQVLGGLGVGAGLSVIPLLAYDVHGSQTLAGIATTAAALGTATAAAGIATSTSRGRRPGLAAGYLVGALGAALALVGAHEGSIAVHLVAALLFGAAGAANLQARFAATDLSRVEHRGRDLSMVVWATTVGAVLGPNLTEPGARVAVVLGVPALAGPFLFALLSFLAAGVVQAVGLRPDPLLLARQLVGQDPAGSPVTRGEAWRLVRGSDDASTAILVMVAAQAVMVGVMTMSPIHMMRNGADLEIVGLTISLHIAGMYALSPLVGRLTDMLGRRPLMLAGLVQLAVSALLVAGGAPASPSSFTLGLILLGTGWSFALVAGSALLTDAVEVDARPAAQGLGDLAMSSAGGIAAIAAGAIASANGYPTMAIASLFLLLLPAWRIVLPLVLRRTAVVG